MSQRHGIDDVSLTLSTKALEELETELERKRTEPNEVFGATP